MNGGSFGETGALPAAFTVVGDERSQTFASPFVKLGVSTQITTSGGITITPNATIGYRRSAAADGSAVTLVADDGTVFDGNRASLNRDSLLLGASLTAHRRNVTVYLRYRGQISDGWSDNGGALGVRLAF